MKNHNIITRATVFAVFFVFTFIYFSVSASAHEQNEGSHISTSSSKNTETAYTGSRNLDLIVPHETNLIQKITANLFKTSNSKGNIIGDNSVSLPTIKTGTIEVEHADSFKDNTDIPLYWFTEDGSAEHTLISAPTNENIINIGETAHVELDSYDSQSTYIWPDANGIHPITSENTNNSPLQQPGGDKPEKLKIAFVLVNYQNSAQVAFKQSQGQDLFFNNNSTINKIFKQNSYNKMSLSGDVFGWYTIPQNEPATCPLTNPPTSVITDNGIDVTQYDRVFMLVQCSGVNSYSGYAPIQPINGLVDAVGIIDSGALLQWNLDLPYPYTILDRIVVHEMGHTMGGDDGYVPHEHALDCGDQLPFPYNSGCTSIEYGNLFSPMGLGSIANGFMGPLRAWLGWIPAENVVTIDHSGTYTLKPIENNGATIGKIKFANGTEPFYLEVRTSKGFDKNMNPGLYMAYVPYNIVQGTTMPPNYLLDLVPTTDTWDVDEQNSGLTIGGSYTDIRNAVTINNIKKIGDGNDFALKFDVTLGDNYTCEQNPYVYIHSIAQDSFAKTLKVSVGVYSNDALPCDNTMYTLTASYPDGFSLDPSMGNPYPYLGLDPNKYWISGTFTFNAPGGLAAGSYPVTFTVKSNTNAQIVGTTTATWVQLPTANDNNVFN